MDVALKLAAEGAGERIDNLRNLSWDQVQQGLIASYKSVKNTLTADVPAYEIDKAFGEFINNAQTDKAIGGLAFDNAIGMVVGYAGGKLVGWTAGKGWETLAPAVAQQAEQFLKSQGLVFNVVPEDGLKYAPTLKHDPVYGAGWGSPMNLETSTAQRVLNDSIQAGKQRYGFIDGDVYVFQPDNAGGWHGYLLPSQETPNIVLREWRRNGTITNAEYNKLRKGQ